MIKYVDELDDMISLWQEAFGDSREDVIFFCRNVKDAKCLGYYEDDVLASMMFLVECKVSGFTAAYVYAACTDKRFRQQGKMAELLLWCKTNLDIPVCLLPANEHLIDYYKNNGIDKEIGIHDICFDQIPEIEEYLFEGCELENPIALMYIRR